MGPDGVPPVLLRSCADSLSLPLTILFNRSIKEGTFPSVWKESFITPMFKSGDKSSIEEYRPVCSLSTIPKLMEKMLVNHITPPVRQFLIPEQHGFLSGRPTVTNLMVFQDYILEAFRRGRQVDCVYTDFSKCFHKIPHPQLFAKLREFGFHGELYQWLVSYLSGRRMMVRLKGYYSRPFATTSGTPQGSHIGPLIFLIYINGINSVFEGRVRFLLFADDVKMFVEVDDPNDCVELQTNLDRFQH
ncbi:unnamed protein product, partial [Nesidiocoris tenuis]